MVISAKTEYAAIAMLELAARHASQQPVCVRDIAEAHGIPSRFLVQILHQLKNAGLVSSTRGASGGYRLADAPEGVTLGDVIAVMEGPRDQLASNITAQTPVSQTLLRARQQASDAEQEILQGFTLADLLEQSRGQEAEMYFI